MEGNIFVDGVLASCYASANHDLADIGMAPIRWFREIMEWMFGEDNGFHVYALLAEGLGTWVVLPGQPNRILAK